MPLDILLREKFEFVIITQLAIYVSNLGIFKATEFR